MSRSQATGGTREGGADTSEGRPVAEYAWVENHERVSGRLKRLPIILGALWRWGGRDVEQTMFGNIE